MTSLSCEQPSHAPSIALSKSKIKKIAVFLPQPYHGGTLRGAKNFAKMIYLGSRQYEEPVDVVFSCYSGSYDINETFSDLIEMGITVRETTWRPISKKELKAVSNFMPLPNELSSEEFLLPEDGANNFCECDYWIMVSDRTTLPLAPLAPYAIVVYDYIQRYVPELYLSHPEQNLLNFLVNARNASFVLTTTPHTQNDAIQYAGIDARKVILAPMEFQPPQTSRLKPFQNENNYILLATNVAFHKNLKRAMNALERYYLEENGNLDLVIVGHETEQLRDFTESNHCPFVRSIAKKIQMSSVLKKRCKIVGRVSDAEYYQYLSKASFLWHPTLIDNGTYCVVEAAYVNVPSLSSDYPAMRYMNDRFNLNLLFFDPSKTSTMSKKLKEMENTYQKRKADLPTRDFLGKFTAEHLAPEFWSLLRTNLEPAAITGVEKNSPSRSFNELLKNHVLTLPCRSERNLA